jgi:RNA-directed DNA polymerase
MEETKAPVDLLPSEDWELLPWRKLEQYVYHQQKRIYKAASRGNVQAVRRLQQLVMQSRAARLLAVRRVTQDNQGKKTAGVDGVASVPPPDRLILAEHIHPKHWRKPFPARRVWIPKPGKPEKRPLGIPTMRDRACQALAKQALEPEWEAYFEPNSYGFRPGRSCHDAIGAIFNHIRYAPKYVLDADIKGCFDTISHSALLAKLNAYPHMRQAVKAWLKAGVLEDGMLHPTEQGTPQGGVLSPLLANIALHGMEMAVHAAFMRRRDRPAVIRYADDFVILHPTEDGVRKAQQVVAEWLAGMGLILHPTKTALTHTLTRYEDRVGFDFLGFTIRQFPVGRCHTGKTPVRRSLGFKTIITPSQEGIQRHVRELSCIVGAYQTAPQAALIQRLNPVIQGWANYYRTVVAARTFSRCDSLLYGRLRRWATRRHPGKEREWVAAKYWALNQGQGWKFIASDDSKLKYHSATRIIRYTKVRGAASLFDGNLLYWSQRLRDHPLTRNQLARLLRFQQGRCGICGLLFRDGDLIEVDHILPLDLGGEEWLSNKQALHRHCHDRKTASDGSQRANERSGCQ